MNAQTLEIEGVKHALQHTSLEKVRQMTPEQVLKAFYACLITINKLENGC